MLDAVIATNEAIRQAQIDSYDLQIQDLKQAHKEKSITQKDYDEQLKKLEQQKADFINNTTRMTYEEQQAALAAHGEKMVELGQAIVELNNQLAGGNINAKDYGEKAPFWGRCVDSARNLPSCKKNSESIRKPLMN